MQRSTLSCLVLLLAAGCGDDGTASDGLAPLAEAPTFAVVLSDYSSAAVAVLDGNAEVLDPQWIDSGTTVPGLVATLSGDVTLPTQQAGDGSLTLVDRLDTNVVSRFAVPSGALLGQVKTQGETTMSGFSSNPQDVAFVNAQSAWVSRFGVNLDPGAEPMNQGDDLVEIDPQTMTLTESRIDLSEFETTASVEGEDGPVETTVYARPQNAVFVGGRVIVGLARLSLAFDAAAPGVVLAIDPESGGFETIELGEAMRNCGRVSPVPGSTSRFVIGCGGFAQPYGDEPQLRASGGLFLFDVQDGTPTLVASWTPADSEDAPLALENVTSLGGNLVAAVEFGAYDPPRGDVLHAIDLASGEATEIVQAEGAYELGPPAYDPMSGWLVVPDATAGLRRYTVDGSDVTEANPIDLGAGTGLPVRRAYLLR